MFVRFEMSRDHDHGNGFRAAFEALEGAFSCVAKVVVLRNGKFDARKRRFRTLDCSQSFDRKR